MFKGKWEFVRLLVGSGDRRKCIPEKKMSICEDLEMVKNTAHSGNSKKFNVLVIETRNGSGFTRWKSLPASPPSHAKVQREAVRPDVVAQLHEYLRNPGSFSSPHTPGMWLLTSWPNVAVRIPAITPMFQALAWRKK